MLSGMFDESPPSTTCTLICVDSAREFELSASQIWFSSCPSQLVMGGEYCAEKGKDIYGWKIYSYFNNVDSVHGLFVDDAVFRKRKPH